MAEPLKPIEHVLVPIQGDHVLIQVPKARIQEVFELLESEPRPTADRNPEPDPRAREDGAASESKSEDEGAAVTAERPWSADELASLINDGLQPKQLVFLELLLEHPGEKVHTDAARQRLEDSGLLGDTAYSGKALGGVVLSLKRRAKWYNDRAPLFDVVWDRDAWMNAYRLPARYAEPLRAAVARQRTTRT